MEDYSSNLRRTPYLRQVRRSHAGPPRGASLEERAQAFLARRDEELTERRRTLGVSDEVAAFEAFTPAVLVTLGEKGVKSLDDLADLASDELVEIVGKDNMDEAAANEIIMAARAHWFDDEADGGGADGGTGDGDGQARMETPHA